MEEHPRVGDRLASRPADARRGARARAPSGRRSSRSSSAAAPAGLQPAARRSSRPRPRRAHAPAGVSSTLGGPATRRGHAASARGARRRLRAPRGAALARGAPAARSRRRGRTTPFRKRGERIRSATSLGGERTRSSSHAELSGRRDGPLDRCVLGTARPRPSGSPPSRSQTSSPRASQQAPAPPGRSARPTRHELERAARRRGASRSRARWRPVPVQEPAVPAARTPADDLLLEDGDAQRRVALLQLRAPSRAPCSRRRRSRRRPRCPRAEAPTPGPRLGPACFLDPPRRSEARGDGQVEHAARLALR